VKIDQKFNNLKNIKIDTTTAGVIITNTKAMPFKKLKK
jgi:hypothetical protein